MSKQTSVDFLIEEFSAIFGKVNFTAMQGLLLKDAVEKAKEMEKKQSQNYAIFAIRCDRTEMRILEFNDYIKLEENENK
jgi:hypothetical protein